MVQFGYQSLHILGVVIATDGDVLCPIEKNKIRLDKQGYKFITFLTLCMLGNFFMLLLSAQLFQN